MSEPHKVHCRTKLNLNFRTDQELMPIRVQNVAERGRTWQNVAERGRTWQNVAECGRMWQNVA